MKLLSMMMGCFLMLATLTEACELSKMEYYNPFTIGLFECEQGLYEIVITEEGCTLLTITNIPEAYADQAMSRVREHLPRVRTSVPAYTHAKFVRLTDA